MSMWSDIQEALRVARNQIDTVRRESVKIGNIAQDPIVLRNMSSYQLANIKRQLKKYNSKTEQWRD